jgi:beta-lactamase class D
VTLRFTQVFHFALLTIYVGVILLLGSEKELRGKGGQNVEQEQGRRNMMEVGWLVGW